MSKKKMNVLRAGAITMVLALGTSCFMSGTLAKYVTSADGSDSARVAKFGVGVTATGTTFAKEYEADDDSFTLAANSVVAAGTGDRDNVVAPGTKGNMSAVSLTGTPEVAVEVAYAVTTFELGDNWVDADGAYYCPLVFTVGTTKLDGTTYASAAEFETAVKTAIQDFTDQYAANTDLASANVKTPSVSWEWPFSTSDANDVKGTYLGDQAAAGTAATVALEMTVTVTQID